MNKKYNFDKKGDMHILVIEDEQRVAGLIQKGLEEQGFAVTLAYDVYFGNTIHPCTFQTVQSALWICSLRLTA